VLAASCVAAGAVGVVDEAAGTGVADGVAAGGVDPLSEAPQPTIVIENRRRARTKLTAHPLWWLEERERGSSNRTPGS